MKELIDNLKARNINGYFASNKDEALNKALKLIPENSSVGFGGSVTLEQIGMLDVLREREDIQLLDRTKLKTSRKLYELYIRMFSNSSFATHNPLLSTFNS